jgi:glycosyltransferase involved in cell wall biosynthesis
VTVTSPRPPRVVVVSGEKFHAYHLARGAHRAGWLRRFVTTIFDRREPGVPPERVVEIPLAAHAARLIRRLPLPGAQVWAYLVGDNWFDRSARRYAGDADIYHAFNHHALHGMRAAKSAGAVSVVERASAHPVVQDALLREEFARFGLRYPAANRWIVAKHLREYAETDWIVVPSEFVYRTMVAGGVPASKLRLLPLGVDTERFRPADGHDGVFRVLFVGAISLQKGLPYLLEGFRLAGLPRGRSELVLVGAPAPDAGAFLPRYEGLYRHVPFTTHENLAALYQSASVFVLPSLQDGFGMVAYEAAACGVPVIVSENVGASVPDGEGGFVVPIRDAEAIADKLAYLYAHEAIRRRMGTAAREHVSRRTWAGYHQELIRHYREISP